MITFEDIMDDAARYMRGEMDADERAFFEDLLSQHPHLKQDLRFMKLVQLGVADLAKDTSASEKPVGRKLQLVGTWWIWAVSAAAVVIICYLGGAYWLSHQAPTPSPADSVMYIRQVADRQTPPPNSIDIKQLGGGGNNPNSDRGYALTWISNQEVAFTGIYEGEAVLGPSTFKSKGKQDLFFGIYHVQKGFEWVATIGGAETMDRATSLAADSKENLILTGGFGGLADFGDTLVQAQGTDDMGNHDFFIAKFDRQGKLRWMEHGGGLRIDHQQTGINEGLAVVTDASDAIIVSAAYIGSFEIAGKTLPVARPNEGLFIVKYSAEGEPLWLRTAGSNYMIYGKALATDAHGNVYVSGNFGHHVLSGEAYFDGDTLVSRGGRDIFLAKYSSEGELLWVKQAGSAHSEKGHDSSTGVAADPQGNVFICGSFIGNAAFDRDTLYSNGGRDIFLAKYRPDGTLMWARNAGSSKGSGKQVDHAYKVACDQQGNAYITGSFTDSAVFENQVLFTSGDYNFFMAKYNAAGELEWVRQFESLPGFQRAQGAAIAINEEGSIAITGFFSGAIRIENETLHSKGKEDIFILIFNRAGRIISARQMIAYM